jgi:hypothetical protein
MMRNGIVIITAAFASLALLACSGPSIRNLETADVFKPVYGRPAGFEEASRQAFLNMRSPANVAYYRLIDQQFGEEFRDALKHCRWDVNETRGATLLYRLDPSGNRVESMVYPISALSDCMQPYVNTYTFPPPPAEDYWVGIYIPGCTNSGGRGQCMQVYYE